MLHLPDIVESSATNKARERNMGRPVEDALREMELSLSRMTEDGPVENQSPNLPRLKTLFTELKVAWNQYQSQQSLQAPLAHSPQQHQEAPYLEPRLALARMDNNSALYTELLNDFLAHQTPIVKNLSLLLAAGDLTGVTRDTHNLKGLAGNLGMTALFHSAARSESLARIGHCRALEAALTLLANDFSRTENEIHRVLSLGIPETIEASSEVPPFPEVLGKSLPRILIVDDITENIRLLASILADSFEVISATSGGDALEKAEQFAPDLVVLDVVMPDIPGYKVAQELRKRPSTWNIPIIFLTARDDDDGEMIGLEMGAVDYITKPVRASIFRARVRNHVELKLHRDVLARLSTTDGLTGIPNRRAFDEYLQQEWKRAARDHFQISVIIADIDYFKQYNDSCGHQMGDECLRRVALELIATMRRPADMVARYGGEEFACILPQTPMEGAFLVAENLQKAIANAQIIHPNSKVSQFVTMSFGVANLLPSKETSAESLVAVADSMLYIAKEEGRNRIRS